MEQERFEPFSSMISGIYRDIQRIKAEHAEKLGMKMVHIFWVYLLRQHPEGLTASELAANSRSTRSLVSREIEQLQALGYVGTREQTARRRYGWRFVLTEKGRQTAEQIASLALEAQNRASMGIPEAELQSFYRTLSALQIQFHKLAEETGRHEEGETDEGYDHHGLGVRSDAAGSGDTGDSDGAAENRH